MGDGPRRRTRGARRAPRERERALAALPRFRVGLGFSLALALAPSACGSGGSDAPTPRTASDDSEQQSLILPACGKDQVREYRCDALLPLNSALPAPEPYGACPGVIDIVAPTYVPISRTAQFDGVHTEFMRRRAPPGHQCCYSWCARLDVANVSDVPPGSGCNQPLAFTEKLCMPEPEGRISTERAKAPFDRCAAAIRPPQAAAFGEVQRASSGFVAVPSAALLHPGLTNERRGLGYAECCYAWCSIAPPGSGLERNR